MKVMVAPSIYLLGGIGRHATLRMWCQWRESSSLSGGTKHILPYGVMASTGGSNPLGVGSNPTGATNL